jgi:hypothetical protein
MTLLLTSNFLCKFQPPFYCIATTLISIMPLASFDWIEAAHLVPIYRVSKGGICGYLAEGFSEKPGILRMQLPCPDCPGRQDLAVHPTGQIRFVVDAAGFYDMRDAVVRDSNGEQFYDHRRDAIKMSTFRKEPHYFKAMRGLRFSFIHKCGWCAKRFDMAIYWSGERQGFELHIWYTTEPNLTMNPAFKEINEVEAWIFGGDEALRLSKPAFQVWPEEKISLGVIESGPAAGRAHVQGMDVDY